MKPLRGRLSLFFVVLGIAVLVAACGGSGPAKGPEPKTYTVEGVVTDSAGDALVGVTISFSGITTMTTTDDEGKWTSPELTGKVTVTPALDDYTFDPATQEVRGARTGVNFTGTKIPDVGEPDPDEPDPDDPDPMIPTRAILLRAIPIRTIRHCRCTLR